MLTAMIELRLMAVGIAVLVAGCGHDTDSANRWDGQAPTTARDQLVLTAAEFPSGTTKLDLPPERLRAAVADIAAEQQNVSITPAECLVTQQDLSAVTKGLLDESAIIGATAPPGTVLVEFVSSRSVDLAKIADGNKRCGDVAMTTTVDGNPITATAHQQTLDIPQELKGVDAIAYRATSTATASDAIPVTTTAYMGLALVRGTTVAVRVVAPKDALDQALFNQLFIAAVHKVHSAA
jgi:hypothetical protein